MKHALVWVNLNAGPAALVNELDKAVANGWDVLSVTFVPPKDIFLISLQRTGGPPVSETRTSYD
jgi:hypothetical protein